MSEQRDKGPLRLWLKLGPLRLGLKLAYLCVIFTALSLWMGWTLWILWGAPQAWWFGAAAAMFLAVAVVCYHLKRPR